jgi:hypothetical protein
MFDRLDFWITLILIGIAIYYLGWKDFLEPRVMPIIRWISAQLPAMSRSGNHDAPEKAAVAPAVAPTTAALFPIVMTNNEYSGGLSDSGRLQFEERAQTIAALYEAELITNLSKAICKVYGCSVQSAAKTDSTYQMALKTVNRYLQRKAGPRFRTTPEIDAAREALGLKGNRR